MTRLNFLRERAPQYYKNIRIMADIALHTQITEQVINLLPKEAEILDFGAGEGALSQRLVDLGYHVISIDQNEKNFKAENEFIPVDLNNQSQMEGFIEKYSEYFDIVLGIEVIEHLENPWQYIRNLQSILKPGGYFIISTPNISSWYSRIYFLFKGQFPQFLDDSKIYGHINPINYDEILNIFHTLGMKNIQIRPGGVLPKLWINNGMKTLFASFLGVLTRPFMVGHKNGWCSIFIAQK